MKMLEYMTYIVIIGIISIISITGCSTKEEEKVNKLEVSKRQEMRTEIFMKCLEKVPKGPEKTHYNDWSEIVEACESAAFYQSQGRVYEQK